MKKTVQNVPVAYDQSEGRVTAAFEARVETTDHLDWIDIMVKHGKNQFEGWQTLSVRGMEEMYALKHKIDEYIWEHERNGSR